MGRPGPAVSAFELQRAPGQAGVTVPPASPHRHGTPGRWPRTVGRSCPVTPPGAILGLTPSRAPRASARKGRRCRDPRNERARCCQAWAGQRGIRKGLLARPQPVTSGTARDLTWDARAVTSLSTRPNHGRISQMGTLRPTGRPSPALREARFRAAPGLESPAPGKWPRKASWLQGHDPEAGPCLSCGPTSSVGSPSGGGAERRPGRQRGPGAQPAGGTALGGERPAPCAGRPRARRAALQALDATPRGPSLELHPAGWSDVRAITHHVDLFLEKERATALPGPPPWPTAPSRDAGQLSQCRTGKPRPVRKGSSSPPVPGGGARGVCARLGHTPPPTTLPPGDPCQGARGSLRRALGPGWGSPLHAPPPQLSWPQKPREETAGRHGHLRSIRWGFVLR